ncbi:MAG: cell envelope biogenesis protein OmpA [Flavobacteriaceae bacterium]|nr:cell envelope biogenesis protein OmpA [Flavobacteriaceae bacterium]|tara:strand:+ start:12223 stop:13614 length:1392 start_codon:yes stop_codon:yes gene_type:complete
MRKNYILLLITILVFCANNTNAQDKNNQWQFSFGTNAVDINADKNTKFAEFFDVQQNWNVSKSPVSAFSVSKFLGDNLSFGVGASFNSISKYATGLELADVTNDYYSVDAFLKYDLSDLFKVNLLNIELEPFVGVGPGWTWFDNQDGLTGSVSFGVNHWFNEVFGLTLMTEYKNNYDFTGKSPRLDEGTTMRWSAMLSVKFGGTDTDGDGVYDQHDECPEVPGLEEFNGCPDSDSDGIQDSEDDCPMEAGLAEFNGCPDSDGDGISDNKDRCPNVAGLVNMGGCPDSDGDGVENSKDGCPTVSGPKENKGCPWPDSDGDSVLDKDDKCPKIAGSVSNNGCPEGPTKEETAKITKLSKDIQFAFGSTAFTDGTPPVMDEIVGIISKYSGVKFSVEGHTDSVGTKSFNQNLSERRANAVKNYLISQGIDSNRLSSIGFGEDKPIDTNVNANGRSNNRRVEILFMK